MADSTPESSTPNYISGYEDLPQVYITRSAEKDAAYLLPHLKPGMRVLDIGCGPGSISAGLAASVAPGEFHGIDMAQSQIDIATSVAQEARLSNAQFQVADALALPFPDDYFDAVHCNAILVHIPDTSAILAEIYRVLKPGGILGSRDPVFDSCFIEPDIGNLSRLYAICSAVFISNGGHPQMGKELGAKFLEAAFVDIELTATVGSWVPPSEPGAPSTSDEFRSPLLGPPIANPAIELGLATKGEFEQWKKDFITWQESPGACGGYLWGEAIGRKP